MDNWPAWLMVSHHRPLTLKTLMDRRPRPLPRPLPPPPHPTLPRRKKRKAAPRHLRSFRFQNERRKSNRNVFCHRLPWAEAASHFCFFVAPKHWLAPPQIVLLPFRNTKATSFDQMFITFKGRAVFFFVCLPPLCFECCQKQETWGICTEHRLVDYKQFKGYRHWAVLFCRINDCKASRVSIFDVLRWSFDGVERLELLLSGFNGFQWVCFELFLSLSLSFLVVFFPNNSFRWPAPSSDFRKERNRKKIKVLPVPGGSDFSPVVRPN